MFGFLSRHPGGDCGPVSALSKRWILLLKIGFATDEALVVHGLQEPVVQQLVALFVFDLGYAFLCSGLPAAVPGCFQAGTGPATWQELSLSVNFPRYRGSSSHSCGRTRGTPHPWLGTRLSELV